MGRLSFLSGGTLFQAFCLKLALNQDKSLNILRLYKIQCTISSLEKNIEEMIFSDDDDQEVSNE